MFKVMKSKNTFNSYKYNRRSGCWNCHKRGHTIKQCKFPKFLKCSFCGKANIKTIDCLCRKNVLKSIETKLLCEPLRLENGFLVLDVSIEMDNFVAIVDTASPTSSIHLFIADYLRLAGFSIKKDNSIDVIFKIEDQTFKINCLIHNNIEKPITIGLSSLLSMGFRFGHSSSFVRLEHHTNASKTTSCKEFENLIVHGSSYRTEIAMK